jgi:hypothetical protein
MILNGFTARWFLKVALQDDSQWLHCQMVLNGSRAIWFFNGSAIKWF